MADVIITKKDNIYLKLSCNQGIHQELREHYTFFIPNARHHPLVKKKLWDGKKRLYNSKNRELYVGLLSTLIKDLKSFGYTYEYDIESSTDITPEETVQFCDSLNLYSNGSVITHKDYQYSAVYLALKHKRRVIISPTGSGKSAIIYSIMRKLIEDVNGKILIVVPRISLVKQMYGDFVDYSTFNDFVVESNVHMIFKGQDKNSHQKVYISTYQSIQSQDPEYFEQFDAVMIDETHQAKSDSFVKILESCINAEYRLGFTGSLDGCEVNELVIQGLLGKVTKVANTVDLMERGDLANLKINFYELAYSKDVKKELNFETYSDELDWLISYKRRNHFIKQLANSVDGNVLILFQFVEKHGDNLRDLISSNTNKKIHYVHGNIDVDVREQIRKIVENSNYNIIIASYGTFSTGINIRNIHHVIFASTTKSIVRVLQSIGRGLRIAEGKTLCTLHDLCDNLIKRTKQNFSMQHGLKRIEIYNNQKFDYEIIKVNL